MYTFNLLTTTSAMCIHLDTKCKYVFHILCHYNAFKIHSISHLTFGRPLQGPPQADTLIKWCCQIAKMSRNINKPSINWSVNSIILCIVLKLFMSFCQNKVLISLSVVCGCPSVCTPAHVFHVTTPCSVDSCRWTCISILSPTVYCALLPTSSGS